MDFTEIDHLFEAASKVLTMDSSHSAVRDKLQGALAAKHRKENAASDNASYYNTPYVRDVFGTEDTGQVVHQKDGKMTLSQYKKGKDGGYDLANHKQVKHAYVVSNDSDADDKKESMVLLVGGNTVEVCEKAVPLTETGEVVVELQEAAGKEAATAKITLITAGKGSMGYYTEAALQKAAKNGVFPKGTQMFLNHQTKEERAARPEGDITKLAGVTTAPAEYIEGSAGLPGRLVAPAKIYPEYKSFIAARKDDIGVSVRVGATPSGKVQDGVPLVENMVYALSTDFVTKAGRGGKIDELYESYRVENPAATSGNQPHQENAMTDEEKNQHAALVARLDRLEEQNVSLVAESRLTSALASSGLKPRGQDRVKTLVMVNVPLTAEKTLDTVKFDEAIKAAVTGEIAYLQESGVQVNQPVVRRLGVVPEQKDDGKELSESEVAAGAEKIMQESVGALLGRKEKTA